MADEKSKKRRFIEILSSSEESKLASSESDDDAAEEINSSTSCNDDDEDGDESEWNYSESDAEDDEVEDCEYAQVDAESTSNKAIQSIRGGSDFDDLNLNECKAYLRRHKLRLSGTKQECMERMKEHWKLKDRNGEVYYPGSSFTIDCTGDVCKGDVVLFHQKVNQISDKTKGMRSFQRRTVAGRIVKESYGAAKQQHTFTVEVLWSKGTKKLDPLFPLLVKGRNLYKMKTFRQPWKNEKERLEVLSEKHKRGAVARSVRAMRKTDKSLTYKDAKHDKNFHHSNSSRTRERAHAKKNCLYNHDVLDKSKKHLCSRNSKHGGFASHTRQPNLIQPPSLPFNHFQSDVFPTQLRNSHSTSGLPYPHHPPSLLFNHFQSDVFPTQLRNSHSTSGLPYPHHPPSIPFNHFQSDVFPTQLRNSHSTSGLPYPHHPPYSEWKEVSHGSNIGSAYSHSWNGNVARSFDHFPRSVSNHTPFYANPDSRRWR